MYVSIFKNTIYNIDIYGIWFESEDFGLNGKLDLYKSLPVDYIKMQIIS